jgi:hypothetical protein
MGEFSIYLRLDEEHAPDRIEELLGGYVEEYESVSYEASTIDDGDEPGVIVPEKALDIDDIEAYVAIFEALQDDPAVYDLSLWGPDSERYPLRAYHYALQHLADPNLYQFHAIDDQETLVICESVMELEQARNEIGQAGLVEGPDAKF